MTTRNLLVASCFLLAACSQQDADKPAASALSPAMPAGALPPPAVALPPTTAANPGPAPPAPAKPAQVLPDAGPLYVCVSESGGERRRTIIALSPPVEALCRKAPEMGPCQYEREACRRSGGKVFTADRTEITRQTEAEYDRRVMRIRMKSN